MVRMLPRSRVTGVPIFGSRLNVSVMIAQCYRRTAAYVGTGPTQFLVSIICGLVVGFIPRLHNEAGSTSWLYERTTSARRASSSSQLHRVNGVLDSLCICC